MSRGRRIGSAVGQVVGDQRGAGADQLGIEARGGDRLRLGGGAAFVLALRAERRAEQPQPAA